MEQRPAAGPGPVPGGAGNVVRFRKISCVDQQGTGLEALSFLAPADWAFEGGVFWPMQNPILPANAAFRVVSPSGREQLEVFPNLAYFWTNNQMLLATFPIGSNYMGSEVRPPMEPVDVLRQIIVPFYRRDARGVREVEGRPLPELVTQIQASRQPGQASPAQMTGGKLRIQYTLGTVAMEEELYAVVEALVIPIPSLFGVLTNINWVVTHLFAFRAPAGTLASHGQTFQTMIRSFRINPQWFNRYNQVVEMMCQNQIQQIRNTGRISQIISQTSNEIRESSMQSWQERSAAHDRIADDFSQTLRGVEEYYDPASQERVELPLGYEGAWSNGLGDYIVTEDPNYNPNADLDLGGNWNPLKR